MIFADLTPREQAAVRAFVRAIAPPGVDANDAEIAREVADWQEGDVLMAAIRGVIASADGTRDTRVALPREWYPHLDHCVFKNTQMSYCLDCACERANNELAARKKAAP